MKKRRCIFLVGFMASGKTTVGKRLAQLLGYAFADTDDLIEERAGMTIRELFNAEGEARFREMERELLEELKRAFEGKETGIPSSQSLHIALARRLPAYRAYAIKGLVISTGGGLPCKGENLQLMKEIGTVLYIKSTIDDILVRLGLRGNGSDRPVFQRLKARGEPREELAKLLAEREEYYIQADRVAENRNGVSPEETARRIIELLDQIE